MDVIVNWIWQGSAIALVVTLGLRLWPRLSATSRYRVWGIALAAVLMLPLLPSLGAPAAAVVPVDTAVVYNVPMPRLPWWPAALATGLWAGHAGWVLLTTARALVGLRRVKRRARRVPAHLEAALGRWNAVRSRGRAARLMISRDVNAAAVFGFGTPVIAIAPAALRTLSADEVEKIVLHEWAHVQRRDDIARLVLMVVRALAGLHPAVWWIDRQLHIERETACDDWAINLTGSPRSYALCLTKLASLVGEPRDARLAPAALTASDLTRRVMRLLDARRSTATKRSFLLTATAMPLVFVVAAVLGRVELVATALPASLPSPTAPAASETARAVAAETSAATPNPPRTPAGAPPAVLPGPVDGAGGAAAAVAVGTPVGQGRGCSAAVRAGCDRRGRHTGRASRSVRRPSAASPHHPARDRRRLRIQPR